MAGVIGTAKAAVLRCFADGTILTPDALAGQAARSAAELAATLMALELKRRITKHTDGVFETRG